MPGWAGREKGVFPIICPGSPKSQFGCWDGEFPWDLKREELEVKVTEIMAVLQGMSVASARRILFNAIRIVEGIKLDLVKFPE